MNKAEKSLRWVVNQIPDFKPTTNEEKMLVAIKLYSEAGAEEIKRLESENAELRARLDNAEIPCHIGDTLYEPFCGTMIREWVVESIHVGLIGVTVNCHRKDDYKWHDSFAIRKLYNDFGEKGRVCLTREAAESRLAELKGGK